MFPRTVAKPVPCLFRGPVEGFAAQNLSCTRHERSYKSTLPRSRNSQPTGPARHILTASCMSRGAVAFRLRRFDGCRNCPKIKFDFVFNGNPRGKRHESEFWKCCAGSEQPPDADPD